MSKQVNALFPEDLYTHAVQWAALQYFTTGERLTLSEVIRRAVCTYLEKRHSTFKGITMQDSKKSINDQYIAAGYFVLTWCDPDTGEECMCLLDEGDVVTITRGGAFKHHASCNHLQPTDQFAPMVYHRD